MSEHLCAEAASRSQPTLRPVFVITGLQAGGAETMLLKLLQHARGWVDPHVISLQSGGALLPLYQRAGIQVESMDMNPGLPDPRVIWRLARRIRALQADVVSTWMYHADLIGGLAGCRAGVPVVWGVRNSGLSRERSSLSTRMVVAACAALSNRVPDLILSCSERARQLHCLRGYCPDHFEVIPNGFELERFVPDAEARLSVREELGLSADALLLGMFARFNVQKNHAALLRCVGRLWRKGVPVHLLLAGREIDANNAALMHLLETAGLKSEVHLLGVRHDMPRLTAALDVACVSASFGEAFPNVLGEAMACGVPCVSTDVGDAADIVGGAGRVVPANDEASLVEALEAVLCMSQQEREALGQQGRERVAQFFDIRRVAQSYEQVFLRVASLEKGRI